MTDRVAKIRHQLQRLDMFAFTPTPRYINEKYVTKRGFIATLAAVLIMLAYVVVTFERFINANPSVTTVMQSTDDTPVTLPPLAMIFRVNDPVTLVPSILFFNESYFHYEMSETDVSEQDLYPRVIRRIPVEQCDVSSWAGWLGTKAFCPKAGFAPTIKGRYQSPNYTFFRIDVAACDPSMPYNSSVTGLPVVCAPQNEINSVIGNGRFNLLINYVSDDPQRSSTWETVMYIVNPMIWQLYEGLWQRRSAELSPNLATRFFSVFYTYALLAQEKYNSRPPSVSAAISGRYVLTLFARMDSLESAEVRSVQTFPDLIGMWGALFGVITSVFALYFARHTEEKFYMRHPKWDQFDGQFRSLGQREELEEMRARGETVPTSSSASGGLEEKLVVATESSGTVKSSTGDATAETAAPKSMRELADRW